MTEVERIQATIARLERKLASSTDPQSAMYYQLCIVGWRAELRRAREGTSCEKNHSLD